jgi:hypothetical protein
MKTSDYGVPEMSYVHLTMDERNVIYRMQWQGFATMLTPVSLRLLSVSVVYIPYADTLLPITKQNTDE